jgi:L-seryl-tRNA(Ser) seleniumtransferase
MDARRALPSVSALLESAALRPLLGRAPRTVVADAVRDALHEARDTHDLASVTHEEWAARVARALDARLQPSLRPAINATGIVLHTNLGRSPLAPAALQAIQLVAAGYTNLEYDLAAGARGSRYVHCVGLLRELTGAEDALVVNNCAAALVLALDTLASEREAIVSRGELVEIGGSFRIPDIMAKSGATLVEVGTTNRTHLEDYELAIGPRTGAIVKVHRSNFTVSGFTADVDVPSLAALGRKHDVPVLHDFGSGLLLDLAPYGLAGEPTLRHAVQAGASLVLASGDKLLGGPQAGIILGHASVIARLRKNPLARALRVDKLTLAALEATLALYRDDAQAVREIPVLAMLTTTAERLGERARALCLRLAQHGITASVHDTETTVGGGAFPTARIPSRAVQLAGDAMALERALRSGVTPVIGRIADDRLLLDLRSVPASDDDALASAILTAIHS